MSIIILRFIHVVKGSSSECLCNAEQYPIVWTIVYSPIYLLSNEDSGDSNFWLLKNEAAINISGQIFVWTYAFDSFE